jgi:MoaA/NifB/PqqE/SkfB family radical SAM enzyme
MVLPQLTFRLLGSVSPRCLWKFTWNFGIKGIVSIRRFEQRLKKGIWFPPFLHLSIINSCNLRCQGCWVDVDAPVESIDLEAMDRLISDAKKHGNCMFGMLGGEPLMHPQLFQMLAKHPDCYFQIFTNGQFITEKVAAEMRRLGNVTPLISIEGLKAVSDERRGKKDVYEKTLRGLQNCIDARLLTGVASSICQSNIEELVQQSWLEELVRMGVHYVWYYTYRPVGPKAAPQLTLHPKQHLRVRKFVVEMRCKVPIIIVDAYYDDKGQALCPSVVGLSHHISPRGEVEPCPVIQFAAENIRDNASIYELLANSRFLDDYRKTTSRNTRGCIVLERPDLLKQLILRNGARDTTARRTAMAELEAMQPWSSQYSPGQEIPEKHWAYRLGKKFMFKDFGAYVNLGQTERSTAKPGKNGDKPA